ncbi:4303_t:CDS:2, partial [Gigaspora margarita]
HTPKFYLLYNAKVKSCLSEPGDVEMNANSSSGAKLKKKKAISTVIKETRSSNAKRKAITTMVNIEKSDLNDNNGSSVTRELETERISTTEPKSTMKNEAPSTKMDYMKDMVGEFKRKSDFDNLEISSAVNVYELPEEIDTNESPGKTVADEPSGATEPPSRTQKVLDEIVLQEVCHKSIQSEESWKEFIEKFLTGNTFNNC